MAKPLHTPRVNNNDDWVQLIALHVAPGDRVRRGDLIAEVETDKAVSEVEAEQDGYVLEIRAEPHARIQVGAILMWLGDRPDEPVPELTEMPDPKDGRASGVRPTAKALALLRRYGLSPDQVPTSGERLSAAEVEIYASRKGLTGATPGALAPVRERQPATAGELVDLSAEERGMLTTVIWHRDQAAAAYLEIEYDPAVWERTAAAHASRKGLMLSPLLSLMAYRLVRLAVERPKLNSTLLGERRYQYAPVNLGFTVQAGTTLYLAVVQDAGTMALDHFLAALGEVQRHAMGHKLKPQESQGATLAFSSMARWGVTRHQPILPPQTALMVAHAATGSHSRAVLGASYDHRVLSGFEVARLLQDLAKPPAID